MSLMQDCITTLAARHASSLEAEYQAAIDAAGGTGWSRDEIRQRCRLIRLAGSPVETLHIDGVPMLEIHPTQSELIEGSEAYTLKVTMNVRRLYAEKP